VSWSPEEFVEINTPQSDYVDKGVLCTLPFENDVFVPFEPYWGGNPFQIGAMSPWDGVLEPMGSSQ